MANNNSIPIEQKLGRLRRDSEERAAKRLAEEIGYPYLDLSKAAIALEAVKLVPEEKAKQAKLAAVEISVQKLAVVTTDPRFPEVVEVIKDLELKKYKVKVFVASLSSVKQAWAFYEYVSPEAKDITGKVGIDKQKFGEFTKRWVSIQVFKEELEGSNFATVSTTDIFEMVLAEGLISRASDIHFEAGEEIVRVRFRVDGLLHDVLSNLPRISYEKLVSRIKLLSGLKINVRNEPQDGRFTINVAGKEIEMRVSIIPSEFGETIVMRILNPDAIKVGLKDLGLREDDLEIVKKQLGKPNGLVLNTGPTGSGKTTTLYAFLQSLSSSETKIITIEDPIEYRLEGIEQTQVDPSAQYTFAKGLRAIVRQDPDVILVGEVRDLETAEIAMQAALTGHVVFSTLHTNDAIGAVPRLVDLGVKTPTIGPALSLVIAQRLVRRLCDKCKKEKQLVTEDLNKIKELIEKMPERVNREKYDLSAGRTIYEVVGCNECNGFGYKGRIGIFEFLEAGAEFEEIILKEASEVTLRKFAVSQGMVTMQEDGILKVLDGITTFDEVEKVTGLIGV